jgi:hypothetical protein
MSAHQVQTDKVIINIGFGFDKDVHSIFNKHINNSKNYNTEIES